MLQFRTLGSLDLRDARGHVLTGVLAQPKRAALLAYLLLAAPRGPQRRDVLLAVFWPERDGDHARNALNQAVHFLRREMGDRAVTSVAEELVVARSDVWCDAGAFEDAFVARDFAEAIELYRGPLLDGFHVAGARGFERWLDGERTRLAACHASALEELARRSERTGDLAGALVWWRRRAAGEPFNSSVALHLMRALAAADDPGGAAAHGKAHERLLRAELDVAPPDAIARFVRGLRSPGSG